MVYLVAGALLLLVASFVYPPLGRAMRKFGQDLEAGRSKSKPRLEPPRQEPIPTPQQSPDVPTVSTGGDRPVFGKRKMVDEPMRPVVPPSGQIFNKELFEGETGDFLRQHGYAPDDPRNQAANVQPLSVLLAEDLAGLRRATEAVNSAASYRLEAWHLLPLELWHGPFGEWLRQHLDLSPCRPWNTIFLPTDETGANALGLPTLPEAAKVTDEMRAMLEIIRETYAGRSPQEGEAVRIMMQGVRSNTPQLFPPDIGDFSERVRNARSDVRALAFTAAVTGGSISRDAIIKSQATFLGRPDQQLVS